jgi:thiamine pyrophosphokinase
MRVFVVAGSPEARRPDFDPGPGDRVIAADSGARHALNWGWSIDLLVGDLDSLSPDEAGQIERAGTQTLRVPPAKDETDTELALQHALALAPERIILCGASGGRADHLLANVLLLARPGLASVDIRLMNGGETICLLQAHGHEAHLNIDGRTGDLLSLLPLGGDAIGVSTKGLLYPLDAETLDEGHARGVSNILTGPRARVGLQQGRLLVIHKRSE